jgi:diguanylate cyclase (GGDEF)-like protein
MFEAEFAEITLFSGGLDEPAYRTTIGPAEARTVMHMLVLERERSFWDDFFRNRSTRLLKGSHLPAEREIGSPIAHEAIISPLVVDDDIGGVVLVANRLDDVSSFRERDGKLLETFARQISVSLENGHLVDSLAQLTELKEELRHQAMHDSLTGLANRANFRDRVVEALEDDPAGVAVLFHDLDDFKTVNDSLGHAAGDQLLMVASDRLRSHAGAGDLVARLGGDEFAILITALREDPEELARRIIQSLEAPVTIDGRNLVARASIGIACGKPGLESGQLLRNADAAMYAAKHHGKGTFRSYEDSMHEEISRILELRATLKDAVRRDELELVYQPVVDLHSGYAVGFESLLRWNHPDKGIIPPAQFVPYAEETGLIVQLGRWALLEACREARRWQDQPEARTVGVAVNISPIQLQESNVVEDVASALAETGLDPDRLTLEITENVLMHTSVVRLEELKDLGVRLAIDDFGTGYSSLSYLDRLPIDVVKIDRTFVERLGRGETSLVRTVLTIGNTLGLGSVVEGVETKPQLDRLRQLGCHHAQGFYLSMPLPANQAREVLNRRLLPADDSDLATITQLPGSA